MVTMSNGIQSGPNISDEGLNILFGETIKKWDTRITTMKMV